MKVKTDILCYAGRNKKCEYTVVNMHKKSGFYKRDINKRYFVKSKI